MWCWLLIPVVALGYTYAGYPVGMALWARLRPRPVRKGPFTGGASVLIAARNEGPRLAAKVRNLLELATTEHIREIWIGLDGCTDGSADAVRAVLAERGDAPGGCRVEILEWGTARGKPSVLNDLMPLATQDVLLMMDARQRVEPGAVTRLLECLVDEQVGVVSGELVYERPDGGVQKSAQSYWAYEKILRSCESRVWAVPGATGALYAIRRELCRPIPSSTLDDDVLIPMRAVLAGWRCLFIPGARVWDMAEARHDREGARKRRTLAGIWQLAVLEPMLSVPWRNPIWFRWVSHKVLRLLTPLWCLWGLAMLAVGAVTASEASMLWRGAFALAVALMALSAVAYALATRLKSRALGLLGMAWNMNRVLVLAAWDAFRGRCDARWR